MFRATVQKCWGEEGAPASGSEEVAGENEVVFLPVEAAVSCGVSRCMKNADTLSEWNYLVVLKLKAVFGRRIAEERPTAEFQESTEARESAVGVASCYMVCVSWMRVAAGEAHPLDF